MAASERGGVAARAEAVLNCCSAETWGVGEGGGVLPVAGVCPGAAEDSRELGGGEDVVR